MRFSRKLQDTATHAVHRARQELKHPIGKAVAVVLLVLLGAAGWYTYHTISNPLAINAPPPVLSADLPDSAPPLPVSVVEAPITYDMSDALDSLELAIPRSYGDINQRIQAGNNRRAHFAFAVSRTPFDLKVDGRTVSLSTVIEYEARGWYLPLIGPTVSAACGTGGVPQQGR